MSKCKLRVPPYAPSEGEEWEREDGVVFVYTANEGWVRKYDKDK